MEQFNQLLEESRRNAARHFGDLPNANNVQRSVRAIEDVATGTTAAVMIVAGSVVLLLGLYLIRRMAPGVHTRRSVLDDPCLRAYMAALEGNNAPAKTEQQNAVAERLPAKTASSTSVRELYR